MSKMPAKKRSCFQITSVTQAQVAASSITDDTESLDDPDESRTEDVSSEILDASRDFETEVCDISSSEETLNSVAENETPGVVASHIHTDGHHVTGIGPPNGGFVHRNTTAMNASTHIVGGSGLVGQAATYSGSVQQQQSATVTASFAANVSSSTSQTAPSAASSTTTSCSSRFRVIKLDHGTGEPYKRGRWTCTEFYEKDTEGSISSRTVDSIKHAVTSDHNVERDSGIGLTGSSITAPGSHAALVTESAPGSGYVTGSHVGPAELQQQSYGISQPGLGPGPQTLQPPGHNGVHQGVTMQHVKSPSMPPSTQSQQFYPGQQTQQPGHSIPSMIQSNQPDYRQQHQPSGSTSQTLSVTSHPVGAPHSQGPSPVMTPAAAGTLIPGLGNQPAETPGPVGMMQPTNKPTLTHQHSGTGVGVGAALPRQPVGQHQPATSAPITQHGVVSGVKNVPAALPSASNTPQSMPNQTQGPGTQVHHSQPRSGSVAGLGVQGLPTSFSQQPPAMVNQAEENQRKPDALPQPSVMAGKDAAKPLIPESLQLATPAVNSLFGISIPVDGEEDSASGASVVAIDNKIEQAMDLVKSHLMYAVREEVEVLKEQIKELYERNSVLERENAVLKSLANSEQLGQLSAQLSNPGNTSPQQQATGSAVPQDASQPAVLPQQPNVSSA
ncbi:TSC22 domain family protein 2 [Chanos chanos]|uniref:TSC22 domain family protein 2 n=1 Tax=Chanos chanos TaxID=29144 RepID=A0A6J2WTB3_CHACN|nr:TSC22 domain family protein 2 [Chanos chanos]